MGSCPQYENRSHQLYPVFSHHYYFIIDLIEGLDCDVHTTQMASVHPHMSIVKMIKQRQDKVKLAKGQQQDCSQVV